MGAPAVSTRAPARRAARPAAKVRPATRAKRAASAGARPRPLTPVAAVERTAVAVGGIADSGFVVRMARSRLWIGVLAVLLGGIVAINVWGLGLSAGSSATAAKIDELQRVNSVLHGRMATKTSNDRIAAAAGDLGLAVPPPDGVHYLGAGANDAQRAAERLAGGKIEVAPPAVAQAEEDIIATETATEAAVVDPAPVDPAAAASTTAAADPATGLAVDPATGAAIDPATGLPLTP